MDEAALVQAAKHGDNEAFYKLMSAHKSRLYNIAYCYLKNEQDALEAIQEVTCRAYVKIKKLKQPECFSSWITRITINYCIDEQKRRKKVVFIEESTISENSYNDPEKLIVEEAVEKLEPKYKKVIMLKYFQDMTTSDIAKVMECPEGTVKTWIFRALGQLRSFLSMGGDCNV